MPKNKVKQSVNVDAIKREVKKLREEYNSKSPQPTFGLPGIGEAAPGTVNRQSFLEQEMGTSKYRQMIHDHNSKNKHILDRLPFTFPKKKIVRSHLTVFLTCPECGYETTGSENTVGFICSSCKKYVNPRNLEAEKRGYNPDLKVGIRGTATDRLYLKESNKK